MWVGLGPWLRHLRAVCVRLGKGLLAMGASSRDAGLRPLGTRSPQPASLPTVTSLPTGSGPRSRSLCHREWALIPTPKPVAPYSLMPQTRGAGGEESVGTLLLFALS